MESHVRVAGREIVRLERVHGGAVGDDESSSVFSQQRVRFGAKPGGMPELEGVPTTIVEVLERVPRVDLGRNGRSAAAARAAARASEIAATARFARREAAGARETSVRRLMCVMYRLTLTAKHEPGRRLGHPARHNGCLRQPIERRVQLDRVETLGVVGEPVALREARGIEDTRPPVRVSQDALAVSAEIDSLEGQLFRALYRRIARFLHWVNRTGSGSSSASRAIREAEDHRRDIENRSSHPGPGP